jgi:hypothetical protein
MAASIPSPQSRSVDAGDVRIGISGWRYAPWRGAFYPRGLVQRAELAHASRQLSTIEINGSFYSLQEPSSWGRWFDETPDDFTFSVKGPRFITHMKKLRDIDAPMANFFASGVLRLGRKLGPVLWQFPPNFGFDPATFEPFLATLPFDTDQALRIAEAPRPPRRRSDLARDRCGAAHPPCGRGAAPELRRSRLHRAAAPVRRRVRRRRHDRPLAREGRPQRRLRLRPAAWFADACTRAHTATTSSTAGRRASRPGAPAGRPPTRA